MEALLGAARGALNAMESARLITGTTNHDMITRLRGWIPHVSWETVTTPSAWRAWITGGALVGVTTVLGIEAFVAAAMQVMRRIGFAIEEYVNVAHVDEIADKCALWIEDALDEDEATFGETGVGDEKHDVRTWIFWVRFVRDACKLVATVQKFMSEQHWFVKTLVATAIYAAAAYSLGGMAVISAILLTFLNGRSFPVFENDPRATARVRLRRLQWNPDVHGAFGEDTPGTRLVGYGNEEMRDTLRIIALDDLIVWNPLGEAPALDVAVPTSTRLPSDIKWFRPSRNERGVDTGIWDMGIGFSSTITPWRNPAQYHDLGSRLLWRLQRTLALLSVEGRDFILRAPTLLVRKRTKGTWHDAASFFPWSDEAWCYWLPPYLRNRLLYYGRPWASPSPGISRFLLDFLEEGVVLSDLGRALTEQDQPNFIPSGLKARRGWWPDAPLGIVVTARSLPIYERDLIHAFAALYGFCILWRDSGTREDGGILTIWKVASLLWPMASLSINEEQARTTKGLFGLGLFATQIPYTVAVKPVLPPPRSPTAPHA